MRWEQSVGGSGDVGLIRNSLITLSGRVGLVLWCRVGMWDETSDF
jgi:hypothetical protein